MSATFENTNIYYIKNAANQLHCGSIKKELGDSLVVSQFTGWHVIPVRTYDNWLTDKQWLALADKRLIIPKSCEVTVQNAIPLTDDLSIAQDTTYVIQ